LSWQTKIQIRELFKFNGLFLLTLSGILLIVVLTFLLINSFYNFLTEASVRVCVLIIFATVIYFFINIIFSKLMSKSIKILTNSIDRISSRGFDQRVPIPKNLEIKDLAESFNRMAETFSSVFEELSSERNTLSVILDTMADGVIVINENDEVTLVNQAAKTILNLSADDFEKMRLAELVRDYEIIQLATRSKITRTILQSEIEIPDQRRLLSLIATPIGHSSPDGVLLTVQDLTHIRQTETSRREFVSNVSHELRSPITSIQVMVETLREGAINESDIANDFLTRIDQDISRMTHMVDELLDLARIEGDQQFMVKTPLHLSPIVQDAISFVKNKSDSSLPKLSSDISEEILVNANGEKIFQVFVNLIENACRFTQSDGFVEIKALNESDNVQISVVDNGIGIADEHLPHVFERFYKVDKSRSDFGTGLGLAIVKHIINAHDGEVNVSSVQGEGSSFTIVLPTE